MLRGQEHISYEGLGSFSLEKRKFCGDQIVTCRYLEEASNKDGDKYFSRPSCPRTRGNGFTLKQHRFRLNIRKKIFTMGVVKHRNRLPREVVDVQSHIQGKIDWSSVEDVIAGELD
ncbi:hypothetical protein DUI87_09094 [Hirundo rustica rustica]|uniref:Uncharacterized protein n=1 Tax=Hirundo rustica rustica TaxID=333673 RepID=A0A3M0KL87_HIRRU|nr:hypothetical protein DUI87_09094 [Hirundo rustica rustica]